MGQSKPLPFGITSCGGGAGQQQAGRPLPAADLSYLPAGGLVEGEHRAGRLPYLGHPPLEPDAGPRGRAVDGDAHREGAAGGDVARGVRGGSVLHPGVTVPVLSRTSVAAV